MKRTKSKIDPLEETMENPDLPPLAPAVPAARSSATPPSGSRRGLRLTLTVGAVVVVLAFIGLRLAG